MIFDTKVHGIPCQCEVTRFTDVIPAVTEGPPDNWTPEEGGEFEFNIRDRRGRPAPWLEKKLTRADEERLYSEFKLECRAEDYNTNY